MDVAEALSIVLSLARGNAFHPEDPEVQNDPVLKRIAKRHQEALDIVEDMTVNQFGDD